MWEDTFFYKKKKKKSEHVFSFSFQFSSKQCSSIYNNKAATTTTTTTQVELFMFCFQNLIIPSLIFRAWGYGKKVGVAIIPIYEYGRKETEESDHINNNSNERERGVG